MCERRAHHAGSWYSSSGSQLAAQLDDFAAAASPTVAADVKVKAIISPHAGYSYCGPTGAWGFKALGEQHRRASISRVVILGPSHHLALNVAALPQGYRQGGSSARKCVSYATPVGGFQLDEAVLQQLADTGKFDELQLADDEAEHSLEMQLAFLRHVLCPMSADPQTVAKLPSIVPIMIGSTNMNQERMYAELLLPLFHDPGTVFVISSDFCHWGERFGYQHLRSEAVVGDQLVYPLTQFPTNGRIEALDRAGMCLIEGQSTEGFNRYLQEEGNTICGRHPISVFLHIADFARAPGKELDLRFVHYSQSSPTEGLEPTQCGGRFSCVSYASGICTQKVACA